MVTVLNSSSSLKTIKGVANKEFEQAISQANYFLIELPPSYQMYDVAIFIDVNGESVHTKAKEEATAVLLCHGATICGG